MCCFLDHHATRKVRVFTWGTIDFQAATRTRFMHSVCGHHMLQVRQGLADLIPSAPPNAARSVRHDLPFAQNEPSIPGVQSATSLYPPVMGLTRDVTRLGNLDDGKHPKRMGQRQPTVRAHVTRRTGVPRAIPLRSPNTSGVLREDRPSRVPIPRTIHGLRAHSRLRRPARSGPQRSEHVHTEITRALHSLIGVTRAHGRLAEGLSSHACPCRRATQRASRQKGDRPRSASASGPAMQMTDEPGCAGVCGRQDILAHGVESRGRRERCAARNHWPRSCPQTHCGPPPLWRKSTKDLRESNGGKHMPTFPWKKYEVGSPSRAHT
jgi:hypothetical protein